MDSQNEEISSILDRFRRSLAKNEMEGVLNELNYYRNNWSTNKFRMFLTNVLIVMRSWTYHGLHLNQSTGVEDWDLDETSDPASAVSDRMQTAAFHLFAAMVNYLQSSKQSDLISTEMEFDMWKRIVTHPWTMNEKFYIYISDEQVILPRRLTESLHNEMYDFYIATAKWSSSTKIRLIELGFLHLLIHDNVFLGCNHILSAQALFTRDDYRAFTEHSRSTGNKTHQLKLITSMNTPEKMKIFLDHYSDVDLAQLIPGNSELYQQRTPLTIFDRLLKMETFFYEGNDHLPLLNQPDFNSDQTNVRPANLLSLFQLLIEKGAKISINLDSAFYQNHRIPFFVSTLGFYLFSSIRYRDALIIPCFDMTGDQDDEILCSASISATPVSPMYLDALNVNYLHYLIKRASTFAPQFRTFFFKHLISSSPLLHTDEFLAYAQARKNVRVRTLYDQLLEQKNALTLKERCRLVIKQSIQNFPRDIRTFTFLPPTLQCYLSFDLLHPNFVSITLDKLVQAQARVKPSFFDELQFYEHDLDDVNGHYDWEDQIAEEVDDDDRDHDDEEEQDYDEMDDHDDADLFDEEQPYSDIDDDDGEDWY